MNILETTHVSQHQEALEKLVRSMGFSIKEITTYSIDHFDTVFLNISTSDPKDHKILIGNDGEVLKALTSLFHKVIDTKERLGCKGNEEAEMSASEKGSTKKPSIDVDFYQKYQIETLVNKARVLAGRVRDFRATLSCDPMNAYERRVVHTALQDFEEISTTSCGHGKERYIQISLSE